MTSPVAVIGLIWDGHDLARPDLDIFFDLAEGLDTLPEVRGEEQLIPFRAGRLPGLRLPHRRPIVANGHVMGPEVVGIRAGFRAYMDDVKGWMDPTAGERILTATLEDGSTRWIRCAARNVLPGEGWVSEYLALSLEWEAVSDPLWRSSWGDWRWDAGLAWDAGWRWADDETFPITIIPTMDPCDYTFNALGTADIGDVRVEVDGPTTGPVTITNLARDIGFTYGVALPLAATRLIVDSGLRTVTVNGAQARQNLTLATANQGGEYLRLSSGSNTIRVTGRPAQVRLAFDRAFQ